MCYFWTACFLVHGYSSTWLANTGYCDTSLNFLLLPLRVRIWVNSSSCLNSMIFCILGPAVPAIPFWVDDFVINVLLQNGFVWLTCPCSMRDGDDAKRCCDLYIMIDTLITMSTSQPQPMQFKGVRVRWDELIAWKMAAMKQGEGFKKSYLQSWIWEVLGRFILLRIKYWAKH